MRGGEEQEGIYMAALKGWRQTRSNVLAFRLAKMGPTSGYKDVYMLLGTTTRGARTRKPPPIHAREYDWGIWGGEKERDSLGIGFI